jgi:hypothetical protein
MSNTKRAVVILVHAFVGWALCAATMGIGMAALPEQTAMIIHAVAAPFIFGAVSWVYFRRFAYTTPLVTAALFVGFVIAMDFFVVALLILGSLEMFASPLGTWIPFALIFGSTWLTGLAVERSVRTVAV